MAAAPRPGTIAGIVEIAIEGTALVARDVSTAENPFFTSVCAMGASCDGVWLAVGQREGGVAVWRLAGPNGEPTAGAFVGRWPTEVPVAFCEISAFHFIVAAVCGTVIERIDLGTRRRIEQIDAGWEIACAAFDEWRATIVARGEGMIAV
jgi:hypothetical protein